MADKLNVITIAGSLRKGSFNAALARQLPKWAPEGMSITEAPPWADFPTYNADDQNATGFPASVTALADAIRAADGVIIVSPRIQLRRPRRPEECDRLGVAHQGPAVQGQAGGDPVGRRRPARRRARAISVAPDLRLPRSAGVHAAGSVRRHGGAEVRREDARVQGRGRASISSSSSLRASRNSSAKWRADAECSGDLRQPAQRLLQRDADARAAGARARRHDISPTRRASTPSRTTITTTRPRPAFRRASRRSPMRSAPPTA